MPALRSVVILALVKLALTMPPSTWGPRTKRLANFFSGPCSAYLAWENEGVASFPVKYHSYSWPCSSLIFCPIFLEFTTFNSMKIQFSYKMPYSGLHGRMRKLDTIKKHGHTQGCRDWTPEVLLQLLHTYLETWRPWVSLLRCLTTAIKMVQNQVQWFNGTDQFTLLPW